jgi:DhnA family fructose-bisphosphate aldolase class Ia
MAVTAVGKELEKRDARYLALCSRIAAELGARVVKTYWCENFDKVVSGCPVPVVMAGGPKVDTELEVFEFVHDGSGERCHWSQPRKKCMAESPPGGHDKSTAIRHP